MKQTETALPLDYMQSAPIQVGTLLTEDSTGSLLITASLTGTAAPVTAKGDSYCARSAGIKKCKNPPCANDLSRKRWNCQGTKSVKKKGS